VFVFMFSFASAQQRISAPISEADVAAWDISILPDGPAAGGQRHARAGLEGIAAKCAVCHGENGKGRLRRALVGGQPLTSASRRPNCRESSGRTRRPSSTSPARDAVAAAAHVDEQESTR